MGKRRSNMLASQIKDQFVNAPQEIRIDFLRKNDQARETESKDLLQTLASFQQEFDQLTSVFNAKASKSNCSTKGKDSKQESETENQGLGLELASGWKSCSATKVVVNPEISQKVQAAESAALAKYMDQMQLQNQIAQNNEAMKSYARPTTHSTSREPTVSKTPLSSQSGKGYSGNEDNGYIDETDAEIVSELREIKEEIMGGINNRDRLIECNRDRVKQKLQERRLSAMTTKGDTERTRAQALRSRQDVDENKSFQRLLGCDSRIIPEFMKLYHLSGVYSNQSPRWNHRWRTTCGKKTKMDWPRKPGSRIDEKM
ncbi:unnamed protein product [Rodentolepis nana]|uniref:NAM-associated domain-containing protein n=1 Tax=Rodentolepis nana TaxID=102285 RepID=A0A0R3TAT8_RODNA|nr:unnamed protein product [Rodentolepis nana]